MREAVEKEVKEKNLNEADANTLLVTTIKVRFGIVISLNQEYVMKWTQIRCS